MYNINIKSPGRHQVNLYDKITFYEKVSEKRRWPQYQVKVQRKYWDPSENKRSLQSDDRTEEVFLKEV